MFEAKFGLFPKVTVTLNNNILEIGSNKLEVDKVVKTYVSSPTPFANGQVYFSIDGKKAKNTFEVAKRGFFYTKKQIDSVNKLLSLTNSEAKAEVPIGTFKKTVEAQKYAQEQLENKENRIILELLNDSDPSNSANAVTLFYGDNAIAFVNSSTNEGYKTKYEIVESVVTKDVETINKKKWLGRTVVGHMILPGFGAVVGALTAKEKEIINNDNSSAMIVLKNTVDDSIRRLIVKITPKNEETIKTLPTITPLEISEDSTPAENKVIVSEEDKVSAIRSYKKTTRRRHTNRRRIQSEKI